MNFLTNAVVLSLVVCIFCLTATSALTCYKCNDCYDPFDVVLFADHTATGCSSCLKHTGTLNGIPMVDRGCGNGMTTGCDIDTDDGHVSEAYCQCAADLCNAASSTSCSRHITALAVFLAVVYGLRRHVHHALM